MAIDHLGRNKLSNFKMKLSRFWVKVLSEQIATVSAYALISLYFNIINARDAYSILLLGPSILSVSISSSVMSSSPPVQIAPVIDVRSFIYQNQKSLPKLPKINPN